MEEALKCLQQRRELLASYIRGNADEIADHSDAAERLEKDTAKKVVIIAVLDRAIEKLSAEEKSK